VDFNSNGVDYCYCWWFTIKKGVKKMIDKKIELSNLASMLRDLDLNKNDTETIKEVLNFIADKIEENID
jgi:hypothetical protein